MNLTMLASLGKSSAGSEANLIAIDDLTIKVIPNERETEVEVKVGFEPEMERKDSVIRLI